uniref:Kazal-type proteinase inhibitor protein n=1 Tax=Haliotis discus discus TaxID=91233 RepID=G8Z4Z4_HALDI|nr:Kazal-type proteinase inhibitor protein [Haliotis discus discus]
MMLKLLSMFAVFVACYSQTTSPIRTICRAINRADCSLFAHHPECGSDGKTYDNRCLFSKAHCQDLTLQAVHNGTCTPSSGTTGTPGTSAIYQFFCSQMATKHCGTDVEHLCGSDHVDYMNFCLFEKARCMNLDLYIASYAKCS